MDDLEERALDAADFYDATREPTRRPLRWIHAAVGPLFDRAAMAPDAEAGAPREED